MTHSRCHSRRVNNNDIPSSIDIGAVESLPLLVGCKLEVRISEEPCFLSRPIRVEVFLLKDEELQHASNIPLQVWVDEEFQTPLRADSGSGVSVICDGKSATDGTRRQPVITGGVAKFSVVAEARAIRGNKVRIRVQRGARGDDSGGGGEGCVGYQLSGKSQEFTLHRYMLTLAPQSGEPFYKDEGGKSKCMEVDVTLIDQTTAAATGAGGGGGAGRRGSGGRAEVGSSHNKAGAGLLPSAVPLSVTLLYENGDVPYQQDILTISPDSDLVTDKHGRAKIRFRIEEVSKSHRGQKFRLLIAADTKESPTSGNVAPVTSDPVLVLSKRKPRPKIISVSRRPRKVQESPTSSICSDRSSRSSQNPQSPLHLSPQKRSASGEGRARGNGKRGRPVGAPEREEFAALTGGGAPTAGGDGQASREGGGEKLASLHFATSGSVRKVEDDETHATYPAAGGDLGFLLGLGTGLIDHDAPTLHAWAKRALALIQERLQWVVVGFEMDSCGNPDPSRPISRCPLCREYRDASNPEATHQGGCQVASIINNFHTLSPSLTASSPVKPQHPGVGTPDHSAEHSTGRYLARRDRSMTEGCLGESTADCSPQRVRSRGVGAFPGMSTAKDEYLGSRRSLPEGELPASMFLTLPDRDEHVQPLHLSKYAEDIVGIHHNGLPGSSSRAASRLGDEKGVFDEEGRMLTMVRCSSSPPPGARDAVVSSGRALGATSLDADSLSTATISIGGTSNENPVNISSSNNSASVTGNVSSIARSAAISAPPSPCPRSNRTLTFTPPGDNNSCATIPSAGVCSPRCRRSHANFSGLSGADINFSSNGFFKARCCGESFDGASEANDGVAAHDEGLHAQGTAAMAGMPAAAADSVEGVRGEQGGVAGFGLMQPDNVRREGSVTFWMGAAGDNRDGVHNDDDNDIVGVVEKPRCAGVEHDANVSREEEEVHHVLGTYMKLEGCDGSGDFFPAYDRQGKFIGLYQEYLESDLRTVLLYHPADAVSVRGLIRSTEELEDKLRCSLSGCNGLAVYSLLEFGRLADLKQRLLTEHALNQIQHVEHTLA